MEHFINIENLFKNKISFVLKKILLTVPNLMKKNPGHGNNNNKKYIVKTEIGQFFFILINLKYNNNDNQL